MNKIAIKMIIFLGIFLYAKSVNYISYFNKITDDCIARIFITNDLLNFSSNPNKDVNENDIDINIFHFIGNGLTCITEKSKDSFLETYFVYQYGTYLNLQVQDTYFVNSYFCFELNFNEYKITSEIEHRDLIRCYDCIGDGNNDYRMQTNCYHNYFYPDNIENKFEYFHYTFRVESLEKIKLQNFAVNEEFYSFNTQQNFYYYFHVNHIPDEIDLINFNTSTNFYMTGKPELVVDYFNYYFKLNFINNNGFTGYLKALQKDNNNEKDIYYNTNSNEFRISDKNGLIYVFSNSDKDNKNDIDIDIKVVAYNCIDCEVSHSKKVSKEGIFYFKIIFYDCFERVYSIIEENNIDIYECSQFRKDNIDSNLNEIVNSLSITKDKNYIVKGQDYSVSITPVDYKMTDIKTMPEIFIPAYANFQECEIILGDYYNIPDNNEIGLFRINFDSSNDDRETVLYRAYWNKNNLDLSLCIMPTTIVTSLPETTIITTLPETTIITTLAQTTITTTLPASTIISTMPQTTVITSTPLTTINIGHCLDKDKYITYDETKDIYFHICPKYLMNEINDNINEIIDKIDINKNYKIQGKDYIAQVSPIDYLNPDLTTEIFAPLTYVNFTECEIILRAKNKIDSPRKLTLIEIQTNNTVDGMLVNEIDYKVYDDKKNMLDLSLCKDQLIKIYGTVKEDSTEKLDLINAFKTKGIDILNISDPFFNDVYLIQMETLI